MSRYVCVGEGKLGRRPHTGAKIEKKKISQKSAVGTQGKILIKFLNTPILSGRNRCTTGFLFVWGFFGGTRV
jgi:hypothetical protein